MYQVYELTELQKKMYICNGLPIYRLPFLMELPQHVTNSQTTAALWKTFQHHPTLQVHYFYEKDQRRFFQKFVPLEECSVELISTTGIKDIYAYIEKKEHILDLAKGYPWKAEILEIENKRYLYIEFHHICIDGLGIRNFEKEFLSRLFGNKDTFISSELCSYSKIKAVKEEARTSALLSPEETGLTKKVGLAFSGKQSCRLDPQLVKKVAEHAKKIGVTKNNFYQSIFEKVTEDYFQGNLYGTVGNWRLTGLSFAEIGCFVRMFPEQRKSQLSIKENAQRLFAHAVKRFGQREVPKKIIAHQYKVIYSYEENMFDSFEFVPVDKLCKFDFYFRIEQKTEQTFLEIEYSRNYFSDSRIKKILKDFCRLIAIYSLEESVNENYQSAVGNN
ncbi:condensation domain-containing protein [Enterococcus sp. LJL98]